MATTLAVRTVGELTARQVGALITNSRVSSFQVVAGKEVTAGSWEGAPPEKYGDLFSDTPPVNAVAMMARTSVHKVGDRYFRRRLGWWATPDRIVVTSREQPLVKLKGNLKPVGDWAREDTRTYLPLMPVRYRVGKVSVDATRKTTTGISSEPMAQTGFEKRHGEAVKNIGYLPAPVRDSVMNRIPNPTVFEADALKYHQNGGYWKVQVLKLDGIQALVLTATRVDGEGFWTVEQRLYDFGSIPDTEISAGKVKRAIGK